jgi:hypothetical protein
VTPDDLVQMRLIEQLKYAYVRSIDLKEWDAIEDLFVPEATATYSDGKYSFDGRDAIMAFLRESMASTNMLTSHKVHQPEITLYPEGRGDTATATWALEDVVVHLDYNMEIRGAAFYHDTYVKVDGAWKIKHTGYERVYEEMEPRAENIKLTSRRWKD